MAEAGRALNGRMSERTLANLDCGGGDARARAPVIRRQNCVRTRCTKVRTLVPSVCGGSLRDVILNVTA